MFPQTPHIECVAQFDLVGDVNYVESPSERKRRERDERRQAAAAKEADK
jgi:hypothetical protein